MIATPSLWRMGAGWCLWRLSWFIAWVFWWEFVASLAWVLRILAHCVVTIMSACTTSFVDLLMLPFDVFRGICGENLGNVFLLFFMVLWVPNFATLWRKTMLMLWHAFLLLGLRPVGFSPFFIRFALWFPLPFLVKTFEYDKTQHRKHKRAL
jgi:hypothetical protein